MPPFLLNHVGDGMYNNKQRQCQSIFPMPQRSFPKIRPQWSYTVENTCVVLAGIVAQLILYQLAFRLWVCTAITLVITSSAVAYSTSWKTIHEIVLLLMFFETVPVVLFGIPLAYGGLWIMDH
jgi:hypothetical protein